MSKTGLILFHGFFEHKERHKLNKEWFEKLGIESHLIDLPGHGENALIRGDISSWEEVDSVLQTSFKKIEHCETKILFGHSFGGQVALYSILSGLLDPDYLILSAPTLDDNYPNVVKKLSIVISKIAPEFRFPSSVSKKNLSTDKEVVEDYFQDPLVFRSVTARYGKELIDNQTFVNDNIENLSTPTILFHGENDTIVPIKASNGIKQLENVEFITVENSKHEILNQDTRPFVLSELHRWLREKQII